jgi:hypothetical protein
MAYNFLRGDCDSPSCSHPTCATGCLKTTWPGLCWTWSTCSTWHRSLPPTGLTATAERPTTPRPCSACCCTPTALACAPRDRASDAAPRTSPSASWPRLRRAKAQLEAEAAARQQCYQQRVADLAAAAQAKGKQPRAHIKPRARDEAPNPKAVANVTDLDSRVVRTRKGSLQGYNAQAVTTREELIVAAACGSRPRPAAPRRREPAAQA